MADFKSELPHLYPEFYLNFIFRPNHWGGAACDFGNQSFSSPAIFRHCRFCGQRVSTFRRTLSFSNAYEVSQLEKNQLSQPKRGGTATNPESPDHEKRRSLKRRSSKVKPGEIENPGKLKPGLKSFPPRRTRNTEAVFKLRKKPQFFLGARAVLHRRSRMRK